VYDGAVGGGVPPNPLNPYNPLFDAKANQQAQRAQQIRALEMQQQREEQMMMQQQEEQQQREPVLVVDRPVLVVEN
jgi:hypothetical protein